MARKAKQGLDAMAKRALDSDALSRRVLGRAVQRITKVRGLSRNEMAAIVDDAPSQMSRLMTGHFDEFSSDRLLKFFFRLGGSARVLLRIPRWFPRRIRQGQRAMILVHEGD